MPLAARIVTVEPLDPADLVGVAQSLVIDADVFPASSVTFQAAWWQSQVLVARGAGRRVLGFVGVARRGRRAADWYVEALGVAVDAQHQGVGRALMNAALEQARETGASTVSLHVSPVNHPAIELYLSLGFAPRRRLRGFYRPGLFQGSSDAYEMALQL
jgi:ribosomal protein S18 acetylase RimI-like enzyme